jgi:hypothetical protein
MLRKHRAEGVGLANGKEAHVKLWTYIEILGMADKGFRMCQGMPSLFKTNDAAAYQALIDSGEALIASGYSEGVPQTVPGLEEFTFWICETVEDTTLSSRAAMSTSTLRMPIMWRCCALGIKTRLYTSLSSMMSSIS